MSKHITDLLAKFTFIQAVEIWIPNEVPMPKLGEIVSFKKGDYLVVGRPSQREYLKPFQHGVSGKVWSVNPPNKFYLLADESLTFIVKDVLPLPEGKPATLAEMLAWFPPQGRDSRRLK